MNTISINIAIAHIYVHFLWRRRRRHVHRPSRAHVPGPMHVFTRHSGKLQYCIPCSMFTYYSGYDAFGWFINIQNSMLHMARKPHQTKCKYNATKPTRLCIRPNWSTGANRSHFRRCAKMSFSARPRPPRRVPLAAVHQRPCSSRATCWWWEPPAATKQ